MNLIETAPQEPGLLGPETTGRLKLALLYGSVREGRLCDKVAAWVKAQIEAEGSFDVLVVDPRTVYLALATNVPDEHALNALRRAIAEADAYLVVTPEYNHSYPAALKLVIDAVYSEWQAKPVAFISYGGASGGIRAVEHLRQVFAELHAVGIRDSVSFANAWEQFGAQASPDAPTRRSAKELLRRLKWWATALRNARKTAPYS